MIEFQSGPWPTIALANVGIPTGGGGGRLVTSLNYSAFFESKYKELQLFLFSF